ncbi:hypothetical protein KI387_034769 [Taxus chinensis]|uniref:Alpha-mannosidase n=1 Tax=Taxus chinensis TaxID=29808 RepID=A0AA38F747_TAXCH|nr:hypothetical protein KI387_034769 [Taxus chinensis]
MAYSGGWRRGMPLKNKSKRRPSRFTKNLSLAVLFIAAIFTVGILLHDRIANPSKTPDPIRHGKKSARRSRTPSSNSSLGFNLYEAQVDITTKDLYDQIEFLDIDGGAWKQGWDVRYQGNEWDSGKLKIFVVPHSHNDPGWLFTVEEYYSQKTRHILGAVVQALLKDSRRKFIWEEMSYLERWWRDASDLDRKNLIKLVQNGQLEIVGGGWVMNDEANSHYFAIIEQMIEGNLWLKDTVGVVPKNAWAIDPFGYSPTMAYLLRRMGFNNMLIQRTHYEVKKELALHKSLEFMWRQSWDTDENTDIFCHMMPFYSYDVPHTCGPEPAICCQFDFGRMPGFGYGSCPWGYHPVETNSVNVQERALKLLDQYRKKSMLYRTQTLLVPLGDDFRYTSLEEAEAQFRNYQLLFDYINSHPELKAEAKFGTLEDYFRTLREEAKMAFAEEVDASVVPGFPTLSGDFFTYADRNKDYWSGYYVSRPFFKAVDRVLEETLRAAEILFAFVLSSCHKSQCVQFPLAFTDKLIAARRNLALFQHHDGVTGTAKNHVVQDYGTRMHSSLQDLQNIMAKCVQALLEDGFDKGEYKDSQLTQFEHEQVRSVYDIQPMHKAIDITHQKVQSVVFFNPLEEVVDQVVMVVVSKSDVCVMDSNRSPLESQVVPEWGYEKDKFTTGRHRLYWQASIPAMGLRTYYVAHGLTECEKAKLTRLKVFDGMQSFTCPASYECSKLDGDNAEIINKHQTLSFDIKRGLLKMVKEHKDGSQTDIEEEIGVYSSWGSGAYLFKPNGEAQPVVQPGGVLVLSEGPLLQEAFSYPKTIWDQTPISRSIRIYNGKNTVQEFLIEIEYHVELVDYVYNDKELIARFKTDINNERIFFSDLNGFQMMRRETYDKIPLQGNYYPMPSLAFLQDSTGCRFSIHSRQSLGIAGLKNGWLEVMLDRRLTRDDDRGLGQGVMDNRPINVVFHLLIESNVSSLTSLSSSSPRTPSLLSHRVSTQLNYPVHAFLGKPQDVSVLATPSRGFSPVAVSFPCDLHVVSLKVLRPASFLQTQSSREPRFLLILQRRGWDIAYCRKGRLQCRTLTDGPMDIFSMFKDFSAVNAKATSLNTLHDDLQEIVSTEISHRKELIGGEQRGLVTMSPMELQAFKLELRRYE